MTRSSDPPAAAVLYRPQDLLTAGRHYQLAAEEIRSRAHGLLAMAGATALQRRDPGLPADLTVRQSGVVAALRRSAADQEAMAADLAETSSRASSADQGRGLLCPLIEGDRGRAEAWSVADRWLTDAVGGGLITSARVAVAAAEQLTGRPAGGPTSGDAGGTFTTRRVETISSGSTIADALDATDNLALLAHDEFGLIDHGSGHFTVVLPGVTDLRRPRSGWNPMHRTPRDLDMAALPSARSTAVGDNIYAQMVAEALTVNEVPADARLMLVGHSYGADTALDLAGDPEFAARYRVTHVVATGYFTPPGTPLVSPATSVLALQNRRDVVVRLGSAMPTTEAGALGCRPPDRVEGGPVSVVEFDGGLDGAGHGVGVYRAALSDQSVLVADHRRIVADFLGSVAAAGYDPPGSMMAVDISLPSQ